MSEGRAHKMQKFDPCDWIVGQLTKLFNFTSYLMFNKKRKVTCAFGALEKEAILVYFKKEREIIFKNPTNH